MTRAFGRKNGRRVMTNPLNESTDTEAELERQNSNEDGTVEMDFYNVFDGKVGRSEGIYLDIEERKAAEVVRAVQEAREPDLSNPGKLPAATGTPMVPEARRVDNAEYSNPSIHFTGHKNVDPVVTLTVDVSDGDDDVDLSQAAQVARERQSQDEALLASADQGGEPQESGAVEAGPADDVLVDGDFNTNDTTV